MFSSLSMAGAPRHHPSLGLGLDSSFLLSFMPLTSLPVLIRKVLPVFSTMWVDSYGLTPLLIAFPSFWDILGFPLRTSDQLFFSVRIRDGFFMLNDLAWKYP